MFRDAEALASLCVQHLVSCSMCIGRGGLCCGCGAAFEGCSLWLLCVSSRGPLSPTVQGTGSSEHLRCLFSLEDCFLYSEWTLTFSVFLLFKAYVQVTTWACIYILENLSL